MQTEEEQLRLAQDPTTSPDILEKLYLTQNEAVRQAIAQNPNTPLPILLRLAESYPSAFCQNPTLPLFLLEDPTFIRRLSMRVQRALTSATEIPEFLIEALLGSYEFLREELAANPGLPASYLERFLESESPQIRFRAAQNPSAPRELMADLLRAGSDANLQGFVASPKEVEPELLERLAHRGVWSRCVAANHPSTPSSLIEKLLTDENPLVRQAVAGRRDISEALLLRLLQDPDERVVFQAAQHPNTPLPTLTEIVERRIPFLFGVVANHPDASPELLARLVKEDSSRFNTVRRATARREDVTEKLLTRLSQDADEEVRLLVAQHPETPSDYLIKLSKDGSPQVRRAVAQNENTPQEVIWHLRRNDPDGYVKREAAKVIETLNFPKKRHHSKPGKPRRPKKR